MSLHAECLITNTPYYAHDLGSLTLENDIISDAKLIVTEIIDDIFCSAIQISETTSENNGFNPDENILENINSFSVKNENFDLTRNYKEEFKNILQNLKCHSLIPQPTSNASLGEQITNVIDDIKNLEAAIRIKDYIEEKYLSYSDNNINYHMTTTTTTTTTPNNKYVSYKSGVIDIHNNPIMGNQITEEHILENLNDEIILQVIDLQPSEDEELTPTSSHNIFLSCNDDMGETVPSRINERTILFEIGDQNTTPVTEDISLRLQHNAGETNVKLPVPNPEPDSEYKPVEECKINSKKKKNIGSRLWSFFKKGSKNKTMNTVAVENSVTNSN